jgi:uncharacterized protein DUF4189
MTTNTTSRRRRIAAATLLAAAGAITAAGLGTAAPASAQVEQFVAIAYSPATGSWGWGNQYDSYNGATSRALSECQSYGGTDCQVAAWAKDGCAALAVRDNRWYGWYGPNPVIAESLALLKNHGGHIVESRCSK